MARGSSGNKSTSSATAKDPPPGVDKNSKQGFAITFIHLGRRGYQITLWASTWTARKKWLEKIEERQNELRERSLVFETVPLSAGYFVGTNRLTCAAPFGKSSFLSPLPSTSSDLVRLQTDNGNRMVYGTENGVYLADLRDKAKVPVKVISVPNVTQLDVLEEQGILIVLADKAVQTFFVDHLDPGDAVGAAKRARKISAHATFFKAGQCLGRTLVCVVKSGNVSSTIKTLEPIDQVRGKKQPAIRKFLQGSNESLRVFKVSHRWAIPRSCAVLTFESLTCRNSTSLPNPPLFISSNRNSALAAPRDSKSSISRLSTRKACSTQQTLHSTLFRNERARNLSPSIESMENSSFVTMVSNYPPRSFLSSLLTRSPQRRVRLLCQQEWMASEVKLDHSMGGIPNFFR